MRYAKLSQGIFGIAVVSSLLATAGVRPAAAAVPAGFTDTQVTPIANPTDLGFTPDGRILITVKTGALRVVQGGSLLATPALSLTVCSQSERGLLGVTVDPDFASNSFIYLFYTTNTSGSCKNRVSRFTLPSSNVISASSELVLIDNMPSQAGNHNAGDVGFGKDGFLYVTIGDGGCDYLSPGSCAGSNDASRDKNTLTGKLLRITKTGGIPATNPFQGTGTGRCNTTGTTTAGNHCQETFAWGFRNPFRIAFDPNATGTRIFVNDVGQDAWEEIDEAQAGADFGWNCREGRHVNNTSGPCSPTPPNMIDPIFEYAHNTQIPGTTSGTSCNSITGGAFVPNGVWPGYDGTYLASDYVCGWIFTLRQGGGGAYTASNFATSLGGSSAVALRFNPFNPGEGLYYTTFAGGGQIRRVFYNSTGNNPPTAAATASPLSGAVPLAVTFDASTSSDPDTGDVLAYFWDFGDGTQLQTTAASFQHSYTTAGTYTATLRARDGDFAFSANTVTFQIFAGNSAPTATMTSPAPADTFAVGQTVTLTGSATDPEDGALAAAGLTWTVILHHNEHTHPFFGPASGNNLTFTGPAPEDLQATNTSYLEVQLTATDSGGQISPVVTRNLQPKKVNLNLATQPSGLGFTLNGVFFGTPQTLVSWQSWELTLGAPSQPGPGGKPYVWSSWSDGGAQSHTFVTPAIPTNLTANFTQSQQAGPYRFWSVPLCRAIDTRNPNSPLGGPILAFNQSRTFNLAGACNLPATAKAIAVNVTAVAPTSGGFVQLYPAGGSAPSTSTLNLVAGKTRANNATLALGPNGGMVVFVSSGASLHLIVDVVGYFD
jgi:glucose/arabinose dehydrogenase/PKD repeat protein